MRGYLAEIESGLEEARQKLRAQYAIVCKMDRFHLHDALRKLLANGLRMYDWLEQQRNALKKGSR